MHNETVETHIRVMKKTAKKLLNLENRKWLRTHLDSYDPGSNRAVFLLAEGSPPRAYIIARDCHACLLDADFKMIATTILDSREDYLSFFVKEKLTKEGMSLCR